MVVELRSKSLPLGRAQASLALLSLNRDFGYLGRSGGIADIVEIAEMVDVIEITKPPNNQTTKQLNHQTTRLLTP